MRFDLDQGISVLERTPDVLRTLLAGLDEAWTRGTEGEGTWSPYDVVGHLIDGEEADWMVRARIILSDDPERRFEPFDRFRHLARGEETLDERLDRLGELRARNLDDLRALALTTEDLARTGFHPDLGTVSLEQLLATWVAHDLGHIVQVGRAMAKQYHAAVGPWKAYMSVFGG